MNNEIVLFDSKNNKNDASPIIDLEKIREEDEKLQQELKRLLLSLEKETRDFDERQKRSIELDRQIDLQKVIFDMEEKRYIELQKEFDVLKKEDEEEKKVIERLEKEGELMKTSYENEMKRLADGLKCIGCYYFNLIQLKSNLNNNETCDEIRKKIKEAVETTSQKVDEIKMKVNQLNSEVIELERKVEKENYSKNLDYLNYCFQQETTILDKQIDELVKEIDTIKRENDLSNTRLVTTSKNSTSVLKLPFFCDRN